MILFIGMSSENQPLPESNRCNFELISFALGISFNECSLAAAELNKQVVDSFNDDLVVEKLYQIGKDNISGKDYKVKYLNNYVISEDQDYFALALALPVPEFIAVRKRKLLLSHIDYEEVGGGDNEPMLVAILKNSDVYVPLATFARREGEACNYVQIGDEIKKDNLFTTTVDETTPRMSIIEKIRGIIGNKTEKNPELLKVLLNHELNNLSNEDEMLKAKEAVLVRQMFEFVELKKNKTMFVIDKETGDFNNEKLNFGHILRFPLSFSLEDNRKVNLIISDRGDKNKLHLLALTRDNIALPLIIFDKETGEVVVSNDSAYINKQKIVDNLTKLIILADEEVKDVSVDVDNKYFHNYGDVEMYHGNLEISPKATTNSIECLTGVQYLQRLGLINLTVRNMEYKTERSYRKRTTPEISSRIREELDELLDNFDGSNSLKNEKNFLGYIVDRYVKNIKSNLINFSEQICQELEVSKQFETAIGSTTKSEELIINKFFKMFSKKSNYTGQINNINLINTTANARVDVRLENPKDTFYSLVISTLPLAMVDVEPIEALRLNFDTKLPLFKLMGYSEKASQDRAKDILAILDLFK